MDFKRGLLLMVFVSGLSAAACTRVIINEGGAPGVNVQDKAPQVGLRLNSVTIVDNGLQYWEGKDEDRWTKLAVESTNSRRTPTGALEVWSVLRNRTDFPLQVEGRTTFFDQQQVPIEGPSAWQRLQLQPNAVAAYREYSTATSSVAYYRIEIREGR